MGGCGPCDGACRGPHAHASVEILHGVVTQWIELLLLWALMQPAHAQRDRRTRAMWVVLVGAATELSVHDDGHLVWYLCAAARRALGLALEGPLDGAVRQALEEEFADADAAAMPEMLDTDGVRRQWCAWRDAGLVRIVADVPR